MPIQILRTSVVDHPPDDLLPGQLAVEMAFDPPRLWVGVPIEIDPSGRRQVSGGGGAWSTGDIKFTYQTVADEGWIIADDGTIGSEVSRATTRANADARPLFELLWNNIPSLPVKIRIHTGDVLDWTRGASAAEDWTSNYQLVLPRTLGRSIIGAGLGQGISEQPLGNWGGQELVALGDGHLASHSHVIPAPYSYAEPAVFQALGFGSHPVNGAWITYVGSGAGHSNIQPTTWLNAMICL